MNMKSVFPIFFVLVTALLLSSCHFNINEGCMDYDYAELYTMGGGEIKGAVSDIDIDWLDGQVNIQYFDGENVEISETSAKSLNEKTTMYHYLDNDGELHIAYCKSGKHKAGTFKGLKKTLLVKIPRNTKLQDISIESVGADITFDTILCDKIDCEVVSVNMLFNQVVCNKIDIESVSSDSITGYFSTLPKAIDIESVSGKVTLYVPTDAGITADVEGIGTNFNSYLPATTHEKKHIIGDGSCHIDMESVSGELNILTLK